jgi:hypothetical protein
MPTQEKLLERQLAQLHDRELREVPAPVPLKLMPDIARDARNLMQAENPRQHRDSESLDVPGFFDKPAVSWPDLENDKQDDGWAVFVRDATTTFVQLLTFLFPQNARILFHSAYVLFFLRLTILVFSAAAISLARELRSSAFTKPSTVPCSREGDILYTLAWPIIVILYCIPFIPFLLFGPAIGYRSTLFKWALLAGDAYLMVLQGAAVCVSWLTYLEWGCDSNQMATTITHNLTTFESKCGSKNSCGQLKSLAAILTTTGFFWMLAFAVTLGQILRQQPSLLARTFMVAEV